FVCPSQGDISSLEDNHSSERRLNRRLSCSPNYRLDRSTRTEVVMRPLGNDAAIIRYRAQSAGTFEGLAFDEDHRCLMVSVRQAADWRIVMEQSSQNG